jgi:hypothetical protein
VVSNFMTVTENLVTVVHADHNIENLKLPTSLNDTKFYYPVHRCLNVQSVKIFECISSTIYSMLNVSALFLVIFRLI